MQPYKTTFDNKSQVPTIVNEILKFIFILTVILKTFLNMFYLLITVF